LVTHTIVLYIQNKKIAAAPIAEVRQTSKDQIFKRVRLPLCSDVKRGQNLEAEARDTRPRPISGGWPRDHFRLEDLTSLPLWHSTFVPKFVESGREASRPTALTPRDWLKVLSHCERRRASTRRKSRHVRFRTRGRASTRGDARQREFNGTHCFQCELSHCARRRASTRPKSNMSRFTTR